MPKDPNRITVDLQLLRDTELEKLATFGQAFTDAVTSLKDMLGGYEAQVGGAASRRYGGGKQGFTAGLSPSASVSGGGTGHGGGGPEESKPGELSPKASIPNSKYGYSFGSPYINDYEKGYFTVGNLANMSGVDLLRYASHIAGERAFERNEDGSYNTQQPISPGLAMVSHRIGGAARLLNYGQTGLQAINRAYAAGRSTISFGQGVGMSSQNNFGIPFTSPASRYTIGQGFSALKQSWFGLNPFYSTSQAMESHALANEYGFVGADANSFSSRLKSLYEDRGIDQNVSASLLNSAYRQGGFTSVDALTQSLYQLRDAAAIAHINTNQFTTDLQGLVETLQQGGLASPVGASFQGQAYSAGTFLSPGAFGDVAQNQMLTYMQMARFHQDYFTATHNVNRGSQSLSTQLAIVERMAGVPMSQWSALHDRNPAAFSQMMSRLQMSLPGVGIHLTVDQLMKMAMSGGSGSSVRRARFSEDMQTASQMDSAGHLTSNMIARLATDAGLPHQALALMQRAGFSLHDEFKNIVDYEKKHAQLSQSQQRKLSIDLAPGARKYFQLVDDTSHRNQAQLDALQATASRPGVLGH